MRGCHDAGGDIIGRVVAGRNFLPLAQDARAGRHVVIIGFRRCRHRRIGKSQGSRVEFIAAHGAQRIRCFIEGDSVLAAGREIADDDRRQGIDPLQPHQMSGIEFDIEDIDPLAMWDQIAPIRARGRSQRRGGNLEVDRAIGIGENEQLIAAIGDRILHAILARRDQAWWRVDIAEIDKLLLGSFMVAAGDHAIAAAGAFVDMGEPTRILLLIDQNVVRLRRAQPIAARPASGDDCRRASHRRMLGNRRSTPTRRRFPQPDRRDQYGWPSPRTRMVKYSEPLMSALHATSL